MSDVAEYTEVAVLGSEVRATRVGQPGYLQLDVATAPIQRSIGATYMLQIARVTACLLAADTLAVIVAYVTTLLVATLLLGHSVNHFYPFALCVVTAHILSIWAIDLYPAVGWHPAQELKQLVRAAAVTATVLLVAVLAVHQNNSPYVFMVGMSFPLLCVLLPLVRSVVRRLMKRLDVHIPFYFVGSREEVLRTYCGMTRFGWNVLKPVGRFVHEHESFESVIASDTEDECTSADFQLQFERRAVYKGTTDDVIPMAAEENVYWLFVVGDSPDYQGSEVRTQLYRAFPQVVSLHSPKMVGGSGNQLLTFGLTSGVRTEESLLLKGPQFVKRVMDILLSASALLLLAPLLLIIGLIVKLTSRGPILFSQERLGCGGKPFSFWKFRSMVSNAPEVLDSYLAKHPELCEEWELTRKLKNDPRITWIGQFLRRTSLDELPQLWNVLIGEMSMVGPRPIERHEVGKYKSTFDYYLRVRPGITGLWQVSGRNQTTYAARLEYVTYYVQNWSPWLDIYILVRTVKTVLFCEGAY